MPQVLLSTAFAIQFATWITTWMLPSAIAVQINSYEVLESTIRHSDHPIDTPENPPSTELKLGTSSVHSLDRSKRVRSDESVATEQTVDFSRSDFPHKLARLADFQPAWVTRSGSNQGDHEQPLRPFSSLVQGPGPWIADTAHEPKTSWLSYDSGNADTHKPEGSRVSYESRNADTSLRLSPHQTSPDEGITSMELAMLTNLATVPSLHGEHPKHTPSHNYVPSHALHVNTLDKSQPIQLANDNVEHQQGSQVTYGLENQYVQNPNSKPLVLLDLLSRLGQAPIIHWAPLRMPAPPNIHVFMGQPGLLRAAEENMLQKYTEVFIQKIYNTSKLLKQFRNIGRRSQTKKFIGIDAALTAVATDPSARYFVCFIRIQSPHQDVDIERPSRLVIVVQSLLRWLVFDHAAFLHKIGISEQDTQAANEEFLSWLTKQLFEPSEDLPVWGQVNHDIPSLDRNAFGPIQQLIIDDLSAAAKVKNTHLVASYLIRIWHTNIYTDTRRYPSISDLDYWKFMQQACEEFKIHQGNLNTCNRGALVVEGGWLGCLQIWNLRHLSDILSSTQKSFKAAKPDVQAMKKGLLKEVEVLQINEIFENMVLQAIQFVKMGASKPPNYWPSTNVSARLIPPKKTVGLKESTDMIIRITDNSRIAIPPSRLKEILITLKFRMENYLTMMLVFSKAGKDDVISNPYVNFSNWLFLEMFNPKAKHSLPIFGICDRKTTQLVKEDFGDIQNLLINYLTRGHSHEEIDQFFAILLGYWFKHEWTEFWSKNFNIDKDYWDLFKHAIQTCKIPYRNYHDHKL